MAGDQLTHRDAVRAGMTSVERLSTVRWEICRPGVVGVRGVGVDPGGCVAARSPVPASVPLH